MESKIIKLKNGLSINTVLSGNPAHPAVVLLHGWPASSLLWRNIIPRLCDKFYVIAPDLPGHGKSDKPRDAIYTLAFLRQFVLDFSDALGLDAICLAAHDLGGMAALSLAARHPEHINKLIIMNTCPYSEISLRLKLSLLVLKQPLLTGVLLHPFILRQVLKTGIHNPRLITPQLVSCYREPWITENLGRRAFSKTIDPTIEQMTEPVEMIKAITTPTLILWGKKDIFFPFSIARRLHQDLEHSKLVGIENSAHFCQEEEPGFIAREISRFLSAPSMQLPGAAQSGLKA
jgi:pimeloyl-ACP methyl ester carboxylesterase